MDHIELHDTEGTQVQGYLACTCGTMVLEHVWHLTAGMCTDCFAQGKARNVFIAEVMHQGRRVNLPKPDRVKQWRGRERTKNIRKAAKRAAQARLADVYPEMFAMLYAQERAKRGLAPVPLRTYEAVAHMGAETWDFDPVYAALSEAGESPDGTT